MEVWGREWVLVTPRSAGWPGRGRALAMPPVVAGLRTAGRTAGLPDPDQRREFGDRLVDHGVDSLPLLRLSVAS